ncbi:MAG: bifunctional hydroxymethylpyrimidine kinase/phosphomethylpyrimidine kinase [Candidatus Binataceae bacterium]
MSAAALTIAGSDPSGGAGIQADLKTFAALRVYGCSAITSVIAQNSAGVRRVAPVEAAMVAAQIETIFAERRPDAIKTGAMARADIVRAVARTIRRLRLPAPVVDPVIVASSGMRLIERGGEKAIRTQLIPLARIVTPNIPEARLLSGVAIDGVESMRAAARTILAMGARAVVIKGGHLGRGAQAIDLLYDGRRWLELSGERIAGGEDIHGTGCAFSAAIAAWLARGATLEDSVRRAKAYVTLAIRRRIRLGRRGRPMLDHFARR